MKFLLAALLALSAFPAPGPPVRAQDPSPAYLARKQELEAAYANGSFADAAAGWAAVGLEGLPPAEKRWVLFRRADAAWRAREGASVDPTELERAREALEELIAGYQRPEQRDETWALAQESLGDWRWTAGRQDF